MPATLETLTNADPRRRYGIQALVMLKVPFRLVSMRVSKYASEMEAVATAVGFTPAQLKT